jgi:hypothetical protein
MAENTLEVALIPPAETPEEGGRSIILVRRALKIVRESAPGQARRLVFFKKKKTGSPRSRGDGESCRRR